MLKFCALRHLGWFALLIACGARSGLVSADSTIVAQGGGGAAGALGEAGGRVGAAGSRSSGGLGGTSSGGAGGSGRAGNTSGGSSPVCTCGVNDRCCEAGERCSVNTCVCLDPRLERVAPPNARNGVSPTAGVVATFSCAPDPNIPRETALRVSGNFAGRLRASFPIPAPLNGVLLQPFAPDTVRPAAYFPGELLTGWVGAPLGGPFTWQFRAAVRAKSSGKFTDTGQALDPAQDVALADLDHDGDLDLVTGSSPDNIGRVWSNDGQGRFSLKASLSAFRAPLLGDVDGDGDIDIVAADLYLNDGALGFTKSVALGEVHTLFDADGDGDLDVFAVQNSSDWALLRNDGAGHFAATTFGKSYIYDAQAGDLDNDGDLDLVLLVVTTAAPAVFSGAVLLNDGHGTFTEANAGLSVDATRTVALGDVDADGDLDVFMASWGAAGARNPADQVWLNDGAAHFTTGDAPLSGSIQVLLADLDGDGDLDAIAGDHPPYSVSGGHPSRVLLNDGAGHFSSSGTLGGPNFQHLAIGDLDGDGDLDAVVAQWDWFAKPAAQVWLQDG